jgi:hypothetical protein
MERKILSLIVALIALLFLMFSGIFHIRSAASKPDATYLTFTISKAGKIDEASGTLSLYANGGTFIKSWKAGSGDNDPAHQYIQWDENDNDPWGGPIPSGTWKVWQQGYNPAHPTWYPLENVTYSGPRFGFYIHGWGKTHGCIAIESGKFDDFASTVNTHWPNATYIPLYVSYPVGNYTGVGGVIFPIDKLALLAPYIGLTSTVIVAAVATVVYVKRVKHKKERQ